MVRTIEVSSAAELTPALIKKIEKTFSSKHKGEQVEFVYKIDKKLIGGILVVDGDKYYDGTIRSQIDKINTSFKLDEKYVEAVSSPKRKRSKKPAKDSVEMQEPDEVIPAPEELTADFIRRHTDKTLSKKVSRFEKSFDVRHAGSVEFCGDGVIICNGLSDAEYGEMLQIENGAQAIVLSLSEDGVGAQ